MDLSGSLPSRERGLKSGNVAVGAEYLVSLPSRERGLKLRNAKEITDEVNVAPFKGAWIEINGFVHLDSLDRSLPSRERGLKFPDKPARTELA